MVVDGFVDAEPVSEGVEGSGSRFGLLGTEEVRIEDGVSLLELLRSLWLDL
jgi:hypothetical protein